MIYYVTEWRASDGQIYKGNSIEELLSNYSRMIVAENVELQENDILVVNGSCEHNMPVFAAHILQKTILKFYEANCKIYYLTTGDILNTRYVARLWLDRFKKNVIIINDKSWVARRVLNNDRIHDEDTYPADMRNELSRSGHIQSPYEETYEKADYLYACLNDKMLGFHRTILIDVLCELDLFKMGNISALFREYRNGDNFISVQEQIKICKEKKLHKFWNMKYLPFVDHKVYNKSWLDIVSETHCQIFDYSHREPVIEEPGFKHSILHRGGSAGPFFNEKTLRPILLGKPFLVAGYRRVHDHIKRSGFELYDEIFDYGFDRIHDHRKRYTVMLENLLRYKNTTVEDRKTLTKKIYEKIIHNNKLAKDMVYNYKNHMHVVGKSQNISDTDESIINFISLFAYWDC